MQEAHQLLLSSNTGFCCFDVVSSERVFIMGAAYKKEKKLKCQRLNFHSGEAKRALYMSRETEWRTGKGRRQRQCGWSGLQLDSGSILDFIHTLEIWTLSNNAGVLMTVCSVVVQLPPPPAPASNQTLTRCEASPGPSVQSDSDQV